MAYYVNIPRLSLVMLIGPARSGKEAFARRYFDEKQIVGVGGPIGLKPGGEGESADVAKLRGQMKSFLGADRVVVVAAPLMDPAERQELIEIARAHHCVPVAVLFKQRLKHGEPLPDAEAAALTGLSLESLRDEGVTGGVFTFRTDEQRDRAEVRVVPMWNDLRHLRGPFDIIGDIHGCIEELRDLLRILDHTVDDREGFGHGIRPGERGLVFLGDLIDGGPDSKAVLRWLPFSWHEKVVIVQGDHDRRYRMFSKRGSRSTDAALMDPLFRATVHAIRGKIGPARFPNWGETGEEMALEWRRSHYVLDGGNLVVSHAAFPHHLHGRASPTVRKWATYGNPEAEDDMVRQPLADDSWIDKAVGDTVLVYGHTPVERPDWRNKTLNIDTGCVHGGHLTALRYPEMELVSVAARRAYVEPGAVS